MRQRIAAPVGGPVQTCRGSDGSFESGCSCSRPSVCCCAARGAFLPVLVIGFPGNEGVDVPFESTSSFLGLEGQLQGSCLFKVPAQLSHPLCHLAGSWVAALSSSPSLSLIHSPKGGGQRFRQPKGRAPSDIWARWNGGVVVAVVPGFFGGKRWRCASCVSWQVCTAGRGSCWWNTWRRGWCAQEALQWWPDVHMRPSSRSLPWFTRSTTPSRNYPRSSPQWSWITSSSRLSRATKCRTVQGPNARPTHMAT